MSSGLHGFGSELTLLYRVAAVAQHYGYEVFLEDSKWNHGTWSDYFEPLSPPVVDVDGSKGNHRAPPRCRLPRPGTKRSKLVLTADEIRTLSLPPSQAGSGDAAPFVPRWTARPHVLWSSRDMDGLDLTFLRLFTSPVDLEALHRSSMDQREAERVFLSPAETMPEPLERAFETLSRVAGQAWKVVPEIEASIRAMEDRILPVEQVPAGRARRAGDLLIAVHVRYVLPFQSVTVLLARLTPWPTTTAWETSSSSCTASKPPQARQTESQRPPRKRLPA